MKTLDFEEWWSGPVNEKAAAHDAWTVASLCATEMEDQRILRIIADLEVAHGGYAVVAFADALRRAIAEQR